MQKSEPKLCSVVMKAINSMLVLFNLEFNKTLYFTQLRRGDDFIGVFCSNLEHWSHKFRVSHSRTERGT